MIGKEKFNKNFRIFKGISLLSVGFLLVLYFNVGKDSKGFKIYQNGVVFDNEKINLLDSDFRELNFLPDNLAKNCSGSISCLDDSLKKFTDDTALQENLLNLENIPFHVGNSCKLNLRASDSKNRVTVKNAEYSYTTFKIKNNLYSDARAAKIPVKVINKIVKAFNGVFDLRKSLRIGNVFSVLLNKNNELIYASLEQNKKKYKIYGYRANSNSNLMYYDDAGNSLSVNSFLSPIKGARISSRFGMRFHPVKKVLKAHRGTDFAAPIGTKICAAFNGQVVHVGNLGAYGKCIILKHANGYKTLYGHMSRYAQNINKFDNVKKGDVIGFVGKTGMATGPHLHFEVIKNGIRINPEKANVFSEEANLSREDMIKFNKFKNNLHNVISNMVS